MDIYKRISLLCWLLIASKALAEQTLRATRESNTPLDTPANVEEGTTIKLLCEFSAYDQALGVRAIYLGTANDTDFYFQSLCSQTPGAVEYSVSQNPKIADGTVSLYFARNTDCDSRSFKATFTVQKDFPISYKCDARYLTDQNPAYSEVVIRTYNEPSEPVLTKVTSGTQLEGERVEYRCTSTGRPAPKLRLFYQGGTVSSEEITHVPSEDLINIDGPETETVVTWNTTAKKDMNAKNLYCQVYDHPSPSGKRSFIEMAVNYGPEDKPHLTLDWNVQSSETFALHCSLEYSGYVIWEWFKDSVDEANKLSSSSQNLTLQRSEFPHVRKDNPDLRVYICRGTNRDNNDKMGTMQYNLTVTTSEVVTKSPGETGATKAGILKWWIILIICVGAVAVVFLIFAIIFFCKRQRNTPANKKKAIAKQDSSGYKNSSMDNNGTVGANPDIIRNNYRPGDVGSPPPNITGPDYRYSQHVEDYADAIDDKPRSRKPIAYSMDELDLEAYPDQSPYIEGGPPAYHTHDPNMYRDYMSTPSHDSYSANYGAPC